jgi:hypothetical protein
MEYAIRGGQHRIACWIDDERGYELDLEFMYFVTL